MTVTVRHRKVSGKAAGNDPTRIYGTHWDEDHEVTGTIDNQQLSDVAGGTIKGRQNTSGTGSPEDLTESQVRTIIGATSDTTDNAIIRADGPNGHTQDSVITIADDGTIAGAIIPVSNFAATVVRIVTSGNVTVSATDQIIILNKGTPAATAVTLPAVATRTPAWLPVKIFDWSGNAGDITITPNGAETIMGAATFVVASGGAVGEGGEIELIPSADLSGWLAR